MKTAKHTATYRFLTILFLLLCGIFFARPCKAEVTYENPDTSYVVSIEDEADLLSDEEESRLSTQMEEITAYGNVAFVSLDTTILQRILTQESTTVSYSAVTAARFS